MVSMPIHNETDYLLTDTMRQHIILDAQEHFRGTDPLHPGAVWHCAPCLQCADAGGALCVFPHGFWFGPYRLLAGDLRLSRGSPGSQRRPGEGRLHWMTRLRMLMRTRRSKGRKVSRLGAVKPPPRYITPPQKLSICSRIREIRED